MRIVFACCLLLFMSAPAAAQLPIGDPNAKPYVRLMAAEKEAALRRMIPRVEDAEVQAILNDPRLILYTEEEMPKAIQIWNGASSGVFSPYYNIAGGADPFREGDSHEFPWKDPFGLHLTKGTSSFKALWLPPAADGLPHPIVYWRAVLKVPNRRNEPRGAGYRWAFPVGARLFEFVTLKDPRGYDYVFSVRMRNREIQDWGVDVFSPVKSPQELIAKTKMIKPDWQTDRGLVDAIAKLEQPTLVWGRGLSDTRHRNRVINKQTAMEYLPYMGADHDTIIRTLLDPRQEFQSCAGEKWRDIAKGPDPSCASTREKFHIVPALYTGAYVGVERKQCFECHFTANTSVDFYDLPREWYGQVPGGDTVFSMHPFAGQSISPNGANRQVVLRQSFLRARIFTAYNKSAHPQHIYHVVNKRE